MNNPYSQFQALIPKSITTVVTITAVNADGTSTADTLAGTSVRVNGDSLSVGDKAYVKDGAIVRKAPDLTITNVDI